MMTSLLIYNGYCFESWNNIQKIMLQNENELVRMLTANLPLMIIIDVLANFLSFQNFDAGIIIFK